MPSSFATCRIGLIFASCAISISDGTGLLSLSLVGTNLEVTFLITFFFMTTFFLMTCFAGFDFFEDVVAILSPL